MFYKTFLLKSNLEFLILKNEEWHKEDYFYLTYINGAVSRIYRILDIVDFKYVNKILSSSILALSKNICVDFPFCLVDLINTF